MQENKSNVLLFKKKVEKKFRENYLKNGERKENKTSFGKERKNMI